MATSNSLSYAEDPTLFLYTSLTAGSSHIITATSRLETILKANKIPFRAIDTATDEKARMIWGRRSRGRKLPGLVRYAQIIGDLEQIEEWNEYGELKEQIEETPPADPTPIKAHDSSCPTKVSAPASRDSSETRHISISEPTKSADRSTTSKLDQTDNPMAMALRQAGAEAAAKAGQKKAAKSTPAIASPPEDAVVEPKIASSMADPGSDPEMTQGKAPTQLAAEGARRTSVDKIAETEKIADAGGIVSETSETPASTEQQVADLRRTSGIAKAPSKLTETQTHDDAREEVYEPKYQERPRTHRGSSISLASKEEIREMERRNSIIEDPDEDALDTSPPPRALAMADIPENVPDPSPATNDVTATEEGEKPAAEDVKPEKTAAKDTGAQV